MEAPDYAKGKTISGDWNGEPYLFENRPLDVYNLTWTVLWSLIRLRISSPRRHRFKIAIADYGYDN